jgi:carbamoyl-phosphate synthase small subunit
MMSSQSSKNSRKRAVLYLKSGLRFDGFAFGAEGETAAEVVFNTSLTGYQEILTDPSYAGQIVTLTNPLIGNYGTRVMDEQANGPKAAGLIVRELASFASNFASEESLDQYLREHNVIGFEGIDTRGLVLHLRQSGAMNGVLSTVDFDSDSLAAKVGAAPNMEGLDLVKEVTVDRAYQFEPKEKYERRGGTKPLHIVAIDCGIKRNILELMARENFNVTVVPAQTSAKEILAMKPDGVFCSNGPGDPAAVTYVIDTLRELVGRTPIFGICLGHQLLALALGAKTYKLKFGHRGGNHPVRDESTKRIEITAQNHGFCVDAATLPEGAEPTHWNLNDNTLEGFRHREKRLFCVQYHPEASPGPHDSVYLFPRFRELIEGRA